MYHVLVVSVALFFAQGYCFGQKNEVDYVKRSEFANVNYMDDTSPLFLAEISYDQETSRRYYYKEIGFNNDLTLQSYSLRYFSKEGYVHPYEDLVMYYSFRDDGSPIYGISLELADTLNLMNSQISIEQTEFSNKAELMIEFFDTDNDSTVFYTIPDHVVATYIDWMYADLDRLDSLDLPNWPIFQDWMPRKSRTSHYDHKNEGELHQLKSYFIDTYYHDSGVSIDTILRQESYSNAVVTQFETSSISTLRTDSTLHKEAFLYYLDQDSTEQEIVDLLHGDTVYRMFLSTKLINGELHSHYRIRQNKASQNSNFYVQSKNAPVVLEREIWLVRDSLGCVIAGNARGIVVDDQLGKVEATTKLFFRDFMDNSGKNLIEGDKRPSRVNKQINNNWFAVQYNLVSVDVNRDLKPLIEIKPLWEWSNGESYDLIYRYHTANPIIRDRPFHKWRNRKSKHIPEYKYGTKRIENDRKRRYQKWEDEQDNVIYEVFFLNKKRQR